MKIRVIPFGNDPIREYAVTHAPTKATMTEYGRGNDTVMFIDDDNRCMKMLMWMGGSYHYKNRKQIVEEHGYIMDH